MDLKFISLYTDIVIYTVYYGGDTNALFYGIAHLFCPAAIVLSAVDSAYRPPMRCGGVVMCRRIFIVCSALFCSFLFCSCGADGPQASSNSPSTQPSNPTYTTPGATFPSTYPSTGKAAPPGKDATPQQVLETFIDCLRKGDHATLCSLFVNPDPEAVAQEALFAFYGPLEVWNVHIDTVATEEMPYVHFDPDITYMYLDFTAKETRGEFGTTGEGGDRPICKFPQFQQVDGVWKIITLGGSSP